MLIRLFVPASHDGNARQATGYYILETVSISAMLQLEQQHTECDNG